MSGQEPLIHTPAAAGLWRRFVAQGAVDHAAWIHACNDGGLVGDCTCGGYLHPERPQKHGARTDYTATCRRCSREVCAPGGRLSKRRRWKRTKES